MRDYRMFDIWLNELLEDTYAQPTDAGHNEMATNAIIAGIPHLEIPCKSVLDVGCGATGFIAPMLAEHGITDYTGVAVKEDAETMKKGDLKFVESDFTFLDMFQDNSFDVVFARHSLEHSPMAILTLFEWRRIAKHYLWIILPNPDYWQWGGKNHYSIMHHDQAHFLFMRADLKLVWKDYNKYEYWFILQKEQPDENILSASN